MDRGAWQVILHGVQRIRHNLVTKQQQQDILASTHYLNQKFELKSCFFFFNFPTFRQKSDSVTHHMYKPELFIEKKINI